MIEILTLAVYVAAAFLPLVVAAVGSVVAFVTGLTRPDWLVLAYVAVLLCNSQGGYGEIEGVGRSLYSRGTGQLFFSFIVLAIYGMLFTSSFWQAFGTTRPHRTNLSIPAWGFVILLLGNLLVALTLDVSFFQVMSGSGFINVVHLAAFGCILLRTMQSSRDLQRLEWIVLLCGAGRAVFGLVRFAFFGGDPANVYDNVENLGVKLTYFDINDSLLASLVLFLCLRRLLERWNELGNAMRLGLSALALMEVAVVALSYRRTAVAGLALVMLFLVLTVNRQQRARIVFAASVALLPALYFMSKRLGAVTNRTGRSVGFFYDLTGGSSFGGVSPRLLELKYSLLSVLDHPVFGLGAWGRYEGTAAIVWQLQGGFAFVHSGVLHLLLKTGFAGGALLVAAVVLFCRFVIRVRKELAGDARPFFDAALAGLLFSIPNFAIGTPIMETRTMLLLGLLIVLPYIIHGIHVRERAAVTV